MKSFSTMAAAAVLAMALPAAAQVSNADAPLDIAADELEVRQGECVSIWRGAAEALQAGARLRADVMTAFLEKQGGSNATPGGSNCGNIVRVEAKGSVYYVTAEGNRARGDAAVYDAANDTITMTGDVVAVQGQNVLRGTRMVFNSKTGEGQMVGQATGRNKSGRVRGVFFPKQQAQAGGQPPR